MATEPEPFEYVFDDRDNLAYNALKYPLTASLIRSSLPVKGKLLDIGTYTGIFYAKHLPELLKEGQVYGVDINPDFIKVSEDRGIRMKQMNLDIDPLPFEDATFDLVMCDSVLEHTLKPREMFEEIARVLKPGGKVLVCVPSATNAQKRWRSLRGDNQFHPLIDNLVNRGYMKRCAVFYDRIDLKAVLGEPFSLKEVQYLDEPYHDPKTLMMKILRLWGRFVPAARDLLIVTAVKK